MDGFDEKKYSSTRQTAGTLFLVAYILSASYWHEFLPIVFSYLALIPIAINFGLLYKAFHFVLSINDKNSKESELPVWYLGF